MLYIKSFIVHREHVHPLLFHVVRWQQKERFRSPAVYSSEDKVTADCGWLVCRFHNTCAVCDIAPWKHWLYFLSCIFNSFVWSKCSICTNNLKHVIGFFIYFFLSFLQCSIEWFHFACVGLTTKPRGKWWEAQ